jgi:hypothetical protein
MKPSKNTMSVLAQIVKHVRAKYPDMNYGF